MERGWGQADSGLQDAYSGISGSVFQEGRACGANRGSTTVHQVGISCPKRILTKALSSPWALGTDSECISG